MATMLSQKLVEAQEANDTVRDFMQRFWRCSDMTTLPGRNSAAYGRPTRNVLRACIRCSTSAHIVGRSIEWLQRGHRSSVRTAASIGI